jgi:hypothetical protein
MQHLGKNTDVQFENPKFNQNERKSMTKTTKF